MARIIEGLGVVKGRVEGEVLATSQPISFWGGVEPSTGVVSDPRHELFGKSIVDRILVFPFAKGSAAAPLVILELVRNSKAPLAMINLETEPLLMSGPILCKHFYGKEIPIVTVDAESFEIFKSGHLAVVDASQGRVRITD